MHLQKPIVLVARMIHSPRFVLECERSNPSAYAALRNPDIPGDDMKASKRNTQVKALENLKSLAIAQVEAARDAVVDRAGEARARTVEMVSQLEKVFERRVSTAISRLGVPSAKEVRALSRQVSELKVSVEKLRRARARA